MIKASRLLQNRPPKETELLGWPVSFSSNKCVPNEHFYVNEDCHFVYYGCGFPSSQSAPFLWGWALCPPFGISIVWVVFFLQGCGTLFVYSVGSAVLQSKQTTPRSTLFRTEGATEALPLPEHFRRFHAGAVPMVLLCSSVFCRSVKQLPTFFAPGFTESCAPETN